MQRKFHRKKYNKERWDEVGVIYQSALDEINWIYEFENQQLKEAIQSVEYAHSLNNILSCITEKEANILARSLRPSLKEWGEKCLHFYKQNKFNKYVDPKTGVVVAKQGGISFSHPGYMAKFVGQGVWDVIKERWVPSSNSSGVRAFDDILHKGFSIGIHKNPPINPPDFSKYPVFPIELISPMHVAALIGDDELMQALMLKGALVNDNHNKWQVTPLELAIIEEHENVIDFILQHEVSTHTALKLAAEKGSLQIIEKIVGMNVPISDDILNVALKRDKKLHAYLNRCRKKDVKDQLERHEGNAFKALNEILNYLVIPIQSLVELIQKDPGIILNIQNEADGNTLLHQLVIAKELKKVKALSRAIEQVHYDNVEFIFDKEKKNKSGKTILDIALEHALKGSKEGKKLGGCILMLNSKINDAQKKSIMSAKIDFNEIRRGKEDKTDNTLANHNQRMNTYQKVLKKTNNELLEAKKEIAQLKEIIAKLNHILNIHQQELDSTKQTGSKTQEEVADLRNIIDEQRQALTVQQDVLEVTIQELISVREEAKLLHDQEQNQQLLLMQAINASNSESRSTDTASNDRSLIFAVPQENNADEIKIEKTHTEPVNLKHQRWNQPSLLNEARSLHGIFTYHSDVKTLVKDIEDEENIYKLEMKQMLGKK